MVLSRIFFCLIKLPKSLWILFWPKEIQELSKGGIGSVWAIGVDALLSLGDPGGVGVITDGRWDWISNSSQLLNLSETDFLSCLRQHCPCDVPANWFNWTSLSILAIAWFRLNIDCSSETEQLLPVESNTDFLPWQVPFDPLRSATLNPLILQSLPANLWA